MTQTLGVGIIGCGNIASQYLGLAPLFKGIEIIACADINPAAAEERANEFKIRSMSVDELLGSDEIDIVVNLTIPAVHASVSADILNAGKHVYSEKPFALTQQETTMLLNLANKHGLRIGSAPDTFLGGVHQHARDLIDSGALGTINSGTAHVQSRGMESWHPNPDFFFKPGAGPILDIGPYYITNLVQLLGPVERVAAITNTPSAERTIGSEERYGEKITVETPTTIHALLLFESGVTITLGASWDVWTHDHNHMELYGDKGSLFIPDPNFFGGDLIMSDGESPVDTMADYDHPFGVPNEENDDGSVRANYRTAGLADMALAIGENRQHRCSAELASHVVDVMISILASGERGEFIDIQSRCDRPDPLGISEARALLK